MCVCVYIEMYMNCDDMRMHDSIYYLYFNFIILLTFVSS